MLERRFERDNYTGGLLESESFGECLSPDTGYLDYTNALKQVRENQPGDPTDPKPRFANDLHAEVALELGLGDDWSELRFYTAVGSALDHYHGVDGFLEYQGGRVTMDITIDPSRKIERKKADFIISREEIDLPKRRQEMATEIAAELKIRQERPADDDRQYGRQLRDRL